jgi:hypothetical protein
MAGASLRLLVLKTRQVDRLRNFYQALGVELAEEKHGSLGPAGGGPRPRRAGGRTLPAVTTALGEQTNGRQPGRNP